MSAVTKRCPPESTWLEYVDDSLDLERVREVETHLIDCERCRGTVLALREESRLLHEVLHQRRPRPVAATVEPAPARGVVFGFPPALAACAAVVTGLGVLLEAKLPGGASWLTPSRLIGVNEMFFDFVFAVRDQAPGLFEFGLAIAATASGAALITFVATALMRKVTGTVAVALLFLGVLGAAEPARAGLDVRGGEDEVVHVPEEEVIQGTLVAHGEAVRVDGVIEGNLIAFSEQLDVRGKVEGTVFAFSRLVELSGEIGGSVVVGSEELRFEGGLDGNLLAGTDRFTTTPRSEVKGDVGLVADRAQLQGRIGRDVAGYAGRISLDAEVGRDADLYTDKLVVESGTAIGGRLTAGTDEEEADIDPGASIAGGTEFVSFDHEEMTGWSKYTQPAYYVWLVLRLAAAFAVGICLYAVLPGLFRGAVPEGSDFLLSMGKGFALLLLTPAAIALLGFTLVGIPLALILTGVFVGAIYLSGIAVAVLVGRHITSAAGEDIRDFGLALLVGLLVLALATMVPGLGVLVRIVTLLAGLGLLLGRAQEAWSAAGSRGALGMGQA
ncbi:MAG: hypothetical protein QNK05_07885 [Myxococcota bacterium]|nr:hypothetical protein [Myxococcota bacterium]